MRTASFLHFMWPVRHVHSSLALLCVLPKSFTIFPCRQSFNISVVGCSYSMFASYSWHEKDGFKMQGNRGSQSKFALFIFFKQRQLIALNRKGAQQRAWIAYGDSTWHASQYKVNKLHQKILNFSLKDMTKTPLKTQRGLIVLNRQGAQQRTWIAYGDCSWNTNKYKVHKLH